MSRVAYPKWIYSKGGSRIVRSEEEHAAAGDGWYESPVLIPANSPVQLDYSALVAKAEGMGIKVDKRWSGARLVQEIEAA